VDEAVEPASDRSNVYVHVEVLLEWAVGCYDFAGKAGNCGVGVAAPDGPLDVPVEQVDQFLAFPRAEVDVVEHYSIVEVSPKISESVAGADDKRLVKLVDSPLGFTCPCCSPDVAGAREGRVE